VGEIRWTKTAGSTEITKLSVGGMDNNVYVLTSGDEAVVVDAGSNEASYVIDQLGGKKMSRILQTHNHGDHVVALREVVEATGAEVLAHPNDKLPVDATTLSDGDEVDGPGGVKLEVLHTPGHTPGSICFLLSEGGESHLFAGDTLFPGGPGNTFGDAKAFETIMGSLEDKLFVLDDSTHVYPGHGEDTTIGAERPSLGEWRKRGW
jgi:glyoxylase-like metal-dependent hydrolase (beta-lactamase superfamily II)